MAVVDLPDRTAKIHFDPSEKMNLASSLPFLAIQAVGLAGLIWGFWHHRWGLLVLGFGLWGIRGFFIAVGYHRYFAHQAYRLNRFWQFVFAFMGTTAAQKGPKWWAGWHRHHHLNSDKAEDVHSPKKGFWWSHMGWIVCPKFSETPNLRGFDGRYPELDWLNSHDWIGPWSLGLICVIAGTALGWSQGFGHALANGLALLWVSFLGSTLVLWHATFTINSLAHTWGKRYYETDDTSRNNIVLALLTWGEGWHNNHHYCQSAAKQGFRRWWQIDAGYYGLWILSKVGIVKGLKRAPSYVLDQQSKN